MDITTTMTWNQFAERCKAGKTQRAFLYTRLINRNLAVLCTFVFCKLGLTPNAVSFLSLLVFGCGLLLLAVGAPSYQYVIPAYLCLAVGYVWDSSDGQLARVTGVSSVAGAFLDHSLDMFRLLALQVSLSWMLIVHLLEDGLIPVWLGSAAVVVNLIGHPSHFFVCEMKDVLARKSSSIAPSRLARPWWKDWPLSFMDYGVVIAIPLLIGVPLAYVVAYGLFGIMYLSMAIIITAQTALLLSRHNGRAG